MATDSAPASMMDCLKSSSISARVTGFSSSCSKVILSLLSFFGFSSDLTVSSTSAFSGFFSVSVAGSVFGTVSLVVFSSDAFVAGVALVSSLVTGFSEAFLSLISLLHLFFLTHLRH
jgi:hypothetical protein